MRYRRLRCQPEFARFLADYLGIRPRISGFTFSSDVRALRFAIKCPRRQTPRNELLDALQAREISAGPSLR